MPYEKIKITDLCRDCGVNRRTFYYHFRNIEDLAAQFIRYEAEALLRNILAEDTERLIRKISDSTGISSTPAAILNVTNEEKEFYIKFYSLAVSGLMESYLPGDFKMPPDKLIECIKKIIRRNIVRQEY